MNNKKIKYIMPLLLIMLLFTTCSQKKSSSTGSTQTQQYTLTVNVYPSGSGRVVLSPSGGVYTAGTVVELTAIPNSGYTFNMWGGDLSGSQNPTTITMNSNKTVIAQFVSGGGSGGTTTYYTLTVNISPTGGGNVVKNPDKQQYIAGESVVVGAIPSSGYQFLNWSGDISSTDNPLNVTITTNIVLTANFQQLSGGGTTYSLSVNVSPQGAGTVSLNPPGGVYTAGTQVTLTATANSGYVFSNWTGALSGTTNPATIIMDSNKTVTAVFTQQQQQQYTLTTNVSPQGAGTVSLNPPGGVYTAGQVVTITAQANSGYRFVNWSGDVTGTSNPTTVEMNANKTVTANFESTSDTARYSFETGVQGWVAQTYVDSQAITNVARDTTRAKYGSASLRCTVDLRGGHANYSKGETYVDLQTAQNLSNATVTLWVWIPSQAEAVPPNGIQVFFKDSNWRSKYSSWKNIGNDIPTNEWVQITINLATEQWGYDENANLNQVRIVGVKIGAGGQSTATFSGYIWIDSVNW